MDDAHEVAHTDYLAHEVAHTDYPMSPTFAVTVSFRH
jgi:hypothetical protein